MGNAEHHIIIRFWEKYIIFLHGKRIFNAHKFLPQVAGFLMVILLTSCTESSDSPFLSHAESSHLQNATEAAFPGELTDSVSSKFTIGPSVNIDALLQHMTLKEKIGQLFIASTNGYFESEDDPDFKKVKRLIKEEYIGGLIFFKGNVYGQAMLTNKFQDMSKIPLWITEDMEFGAAMRIKGATSLTPAMGIAATGNTRNAYLAGRITASEAKAIGVHQIFAPVLDVNNNPHNPVINVRSFSGDPAMVAQFGKSFIDGVKDEGIVSTAKHFPGHGDTDADSHLKLPVLNNDYQRLDTLELVPFKLAIKDSIGSIMSAHIAFPKISSHPDRPATLDKSILHGILRDSLNFNGLVITDGLEMRGITSKYSPGDAVVKALEAGADLMLISPDERTAVYEVEKAVKDGDITEERINHSVRKLLAWKKQHGVFRNSHVDMNQLGKIINNRNYETTAERIARESITVVKNKHDILPIRPKKYPKIMALSMADDRSGDTGEAFGKLIKKYHPDVSFHVYDRRSDRIEKQQILRSARRANLIVIGSFVYVRSYRDIQLSRSQQQFIRQLTRLNKPVAIVAFGNPYVLQDLPNTDVQMLAWSASDQQIEAAVPALFGASDISGKLPINIPGMYKMGDGLHIPQSTIRFDRPESMGLNSDSLYRVAEIMNQAIRDSVFPGGVVGVLKDGVLTYQEGFGYQTYGKHQSVRGNEIYDLASITKIMATTTAVMHLIDQGKLHWDDKVSEYIPAYRSGLKDSVTIRNLLLHNSGLPSYKIYVDKLKDRKSILHAVENEALVGQPGKQYKYSDLGFILLGEIVENITGSRLDHYMRRNFYYPLGMGDTYFNPNRMGYWVRRRIPPTEIDTTFRHKTIDGEVEDPRAYYMDGVAGHAGLFSSVRDMSIFSQMLLNNGTYGGHQYIKPETVQLFTMREAEHSNRGYGFDRKSSEHSTAGSLTSMSTYGHLGFTGTSLWIDPQRNLAIIILTNRTYPHRSYGQNINEIRARVADAVINSITKPL